MKRIIALMLAVCLLLCACGGDKPEDTSAGTTAPETTAAPTETTVPPTTEGTVETTAETTEPPVLYRNPLSGAPMDEPYTGRVFAITINNISQALPHRGVSQADIFFEMFVNNYMVRGLALYSDPTDVEAIGSIRSLRYNFTDLCQAYDAIVVHAGGSDYVLSDLRSSGVQNISVESEAADYYFRDSSRYNSGYAWEHCLFVKGRELVEYADSKGYGVTREPGRNYGLTFTEEPILSGETATKISINLKHDGVTKNTTMTYNETSGRYVYSQYGQVMVDGNTEAPECFRNVIVMFCRVSDETHGETVYHIANLLGSGTGYWACDGQIVPICWSRSGDSDPFTYTLEDGTPVELGVGNTYVALAPSNSTVDYE